MKGRVLHILFKNERDATPISRFEIPPILKEL
jgi:hypothetical protein